MKRAEREVLRAGMVSYVEHMLARQVDSLHELRKSMHGKKSGKEGWSGILLDWETFYSLAKTQIMAIRRTQVILEAITVWHQLRSACLRVSAISEQEPVEEWPSGDQGVNAAIERMNKDEDWIRSLPAPDLVPLEELDDETLETIANFQGGNELAHHDTMEAKRILKARRDHPTYPK